MTTSSDEILMFQLGTNNWQRMKKDGSELEFAPGSGVLHEAHHNSYNDMPNVSSYSMYPSKNQAQPAIPEGSPQGSPQGSPRAKLADYRVFELSNDIPVCESASPSSSKRWHSMSEQEVQEYVNRLEKEVFDYLLEIETVENRKFTHFIAHHAFLNPYVMRNVNRRRVKELGLPCAKLFVFAHGTALKMFWWEKEGKNPVEFPMRFWKWICEEKLFDPNSCTDETDKKCGVQGCFVISNEQKTAVTEIFPTFPPEKIVVAPNGINVEMFKPQNKNLATVIYQQIVVPNQKGELIWSPKDFDFGSLASAIECGKKYGKSIASVGKAAEWKRQKALLHAAKRYESEYPDLVTFCVGTGPENEISKLKLLCTELDLKNTFLLGGRSQPVLAEIYTVSNLGIFPSYKEPFGLVFVECMACGAPVIGCNSGGPKDFITSEVGELVAEPSETTDLSTVEAGIVSLSNGLEECIRRALSEDWKKNKTAAGIHLAQDRFTVDAQVKYILNEASKL